LFERLLRDATRKLSKHSILVILLARLAVDQLAQGKRLGAGLLLDPLQPARDLSGSLGTHAVEVHTLAGSTTGGSTIGSLEMSEKFHAKSPSRRGARKKNRQNSIFFLSIDRVPASLRLNRRIQ
jgi:hypothetical protein